MIVNLDGLSQSIFASFRIVDFFLLVPLSILIMFYSIFKNKVIKTSKLFRFSSANVLLVISIMLYAVYYSEQDSIDKPQEAFKYDIYSGVSKFGFPDFWYWQIKTIESDRTLNKEDKKRIEDWIEMHNEKIGLSGGYSHLGKNIIIIIVESLESFPINSNIENAEITPNLNKIIKSDNCLYFSKVVPQVKGGRSSDAQIIINSGLLPPKSGAASFRFANNKYLTLAKCLNSKGYYSCNFLGGNPSFWNQHVLSKDLGFKDFISIDNYTKDEVYAFGLTDSTFLSQSVKKIEKLKNPFFVQLITLSSHQPYDLINKREYLKVPTDCPSELGKYLNTISYVDKCIGNFINKLDKNGILNNSVLIITGDHEALKTNQSEWNNYTKNWGKMTGFTPLIIYNTINPKNKDINIGQIDIYTSILDLMGLNDYRWKGLGHRVFYSQQSISVIDPQLNVCNNTNSLDTIDTNQMKIAWGISDLILKKNYFNN
jgi:phosphoglycerol transferase MdoB-like AlkP superfamily enzyme